MNTSFKVGDEVRLLVELTVPGFKVPYKPGYIFTVTKINDDGTVEIRRDCVRGHPEITTVQANHVEQARQVVNGTIYSNRTPQAVIIVLERCRQDRRRLRIHYGTTERDVELKGKSERDIGRDWLEEWDVTGTIGRSMGPSKIPLMIAGSRSYGGPGLLDDSIVKIRTTTKPYRVLYQHPSYHAGTFTKHRCRTRLPNGRVLKWLVRRDGEVQARFSTELKANRYVGMFT